MSTASRSKSYLKQLEDYLLEKESEETDNIPFRRSSQSKSSQKPLASNTSSKPKVRESLSKDTTKTKITKSKSNNPQPKYEYASDLLNTKSSHESSLNYSIDISSLPNEVGGMTLEELAHLPLDLSNSSHLDIIDSEINALYESGVDQPRQISSSSSSTRLHSSTLKRQKSNPTLPTVASKEFHNSNIPPPAPVDLSQAKSSLSLLKSKIKQANQNTRVIKKELTQSSGSTNDFENVVPAVVVAPIPSQEEDDEEFDENIPSAATSTYQRIPLPGVTVGKPIPPNDPRGFPLASSEIQNEKQTSATSRKPQSLQEILQQRQNSSNPNNLPMQSEMAERMKNASNTLTSSYASNPYENDQFEEEFEEDDANLPQEECPDCGRKFNQNAFEKHVKICKKVFMQKRKKFDSTKQRLQGDGVDPELKKVYEKAKKEETRAQRGGGGGGGGGMALKHNDQPVGGKGGGGGGGGDSKWKQQSQAFREAMKAARDYAKAKERGEEPPPPVISAPDPSLIPCPHCGRRFNEMAANRHIPQCKNIKAKPTSLKKGGGINAAAGVNAGRSKR